jgi:ABC-type uncharacterized transport system ATPase component
MVSMHMKNSIQIGDRMCHVLEFEGTVVLDSKLEKAWKLSKCD